MQELERREERLETDGNLVPFDHRQEWIEARKSTIGSSDAPIIAGFHPYVSPFTLWAQKTGLLQEPEEENEAMMFGNILEPAVAEMYSRKTKRRITDLGRYTIQYNLKYPFAHSTIDRVVFDDVKGLGIGEMKTTGGFFGTEWAEEAPLVAQIQLQHQLAVGVEEGDLINWGSVAGLIGGFRFRFVYQDFERDEEFIKSLMDKEAEFMELVRSKREPAIDNSTSTAETLRECWRQDSGATIDLPASALEWDEKLEEAKATIKAATSVERECKNNLQALLRDAAYGRLPGGIVYSYTTSDCKAYSVPAGTKRTLRRSLK